MFQSGERPSTPLAVSPKKASTNWSTCTRVTNSYGSHPILRKQLELKKVPGKFLSSSSNMRPNSLASVVVMLSSSKPQSSYFRRVSSRPLATRCQEQKKTQIRPTKWRCNMRIWFEGKPYSTFKTKHWKLQKWCLVDYVHLFLFPVMIYRFHVSFQVLYHPKINWL